MSTNLVPIRSTQQYAAAPGSFMTMGNALSPVRRMAMPGGDRGTEFTVAKIRELGTRG